MRRFTALLLWGVGSFLALAAHAGDTSPATAPFAQLQAAARVALPLEPTALLLNDQSPKHDFGQGLQPFVLIELPAYQAPYEVRLWNESQSAGFLNGRQRTRVVPRIVTLRADFSAARSYSSEQLRERSGSQEKTVFINPQNQDERYILVYGDMNAKPSTLTQSESSAVYVGTGFFLDGRDSTYLLQPVDQGTLRVEVRGIKPPAK